MILEQFSQQVFSNPAFAPLPSAGSGDDGFEDKICHVPGQGHYFFSADQIHGITDIPDQQGFSAGIPL